VTLISTRRILTRGKVLEFLDGLNEAPGAEAFTLYLPSHLTAPEIENALKELPEQPDITPPLAELAGRSQTGSVVFWSQEQTYLVLPPFPVAEKQLTRRLSTEALFSLLRHDHRISLVLVRLGAYAIGVCHGDRLVSSKVGTGLVHGRHRKGGSSAHRFERHRDKQIEYFLTRVCGRIREQLEPYIQSLDYSVYGGARTTIQLLQKQCPFVAKLDRPTLPSLFDIPAPRQAVLETAVSRVWSSTVIEWRED
jgi:hypothetical protein